MKTTLLAFSFGFISGALLSYNQTAQQYEAKARKEQTAYTEVLAEVSQRSDHYQKISEEAGGKEWVHISVCASERKEVLEYNGTTYSKRK